VVSVISAFQDFFPEDFLLIILSLEVEFIKLKILSELVEEGCGLSLPTGVGP